MEKPLAERVALITGASRGIGAATAVELARLGAHVVITARTQGGLEETDDAVRTVGGTATLLPLDLLDFSQVDAIGPSLYQRFGRLDVLVVNAAMLGNLMPLPQLPSAVWEAVFDINVGATWHLIRTAEPLLQASDAGRAVVLTCERASAPLAYWGLFGASMAAREYMTRVWAEEARKTRLRVNLFDPGPVHTRLRRSAFPGEVPDALPKPEEIAPLIGALCLPTEARCGELIRRISDVVR